MSELSEQIAQLVNAEVEKRIHIYQEALRQAISILQTAATADDTSDEITDDDSTHDNQETTTVPAPIVGPAHDTIEPPKKFRDVNGILRRYKKNCLYCGREFATDYAEREFCNRDHLIAYEDGETPDSENFTSALQAIVSTPKRSITGDKDEAHSAEYVRLYAGKRSHKAMKPEVKESPAGTVARSEAQQQRRTVEKTLKRECKNCGRLSTKLFCSDNCRKEFEAAFAKTPTRSGEPAEQTVTYCSRCQAWTTHTTANCPNKPAAPPSPEIPKPLHPDDDFMPGYEKTPEEIEELKHLMDDQRSAFDDPYNCEVCRNAGSLCILHEGMARKGMQPTRYRPSSS